MRKTAYKIMFFKVCVPANLLKFIITTMENKSMINKDVQDNEN